MRVPNIFVALPAYRVRLRGTGWICCRKIDTPRVLDQSNYVYGVWIAKATLENESWAATKTFTQRVEGLAVQGDVDTGVEGKSEAGVAFGAVLGGQIVCSAVWD